MTTNLPIKALGFCLSTILLLQGFAAGGTRTWDGRHSTEKIDLFVVYFVPSDRKPLADWKERVEYYCRRLEKFHRREFGEQSQLTAQMIPTPFISTQDTESLRKGDANSIFFKTLSETDRGIQFQDRRKEGTFPILLVLSEINWRPLDDFFRLRPSEEGLIFEGNYQLGEHFPGATSGGARATYLADRGCGWGLVSADGWRVPYRGSDCVVYHEGCGHTVGLPHPDRANGSVMSLGQYRGWISESWLNQDQKSKLKWMTAETDAENREDLFTSFRAIPNPRVPRPHQSVNLSLNWPQDAKVKRLTVRYQTSIDGPWIDVQQQWDGDSPDQITLGKFDRPTPISYRIDTELENGQSEELWGYLQVRIDEKTFPEPRNLSVDLMGPRPESATTLRTIDQTKSVDLLQEIKLDQAWKAGQWSREDNFIVSPKGYGARLELPSVEADEYQIQMLIEPLDAPNALLVGNRSSGNRFTSLFGFVTEQGYLSAIENIDGRNVGNETTHTGNLFQTNRVSQVIVQVTNQGVVMLVDGVNIVDWKGDAKRLSLSDYWQTPNQNAIFLGTYACRFRFHQILYTPL